MLYKAREGDVIETVENAFFDVKGLLHPPDKIVAFIRFYPDPDGDRVKNKTRYRKVYALSNRYAWLKEKFPEYLVYDPVFNEQLCEVPVEKVKTLYQPIDRLRNLRYGDNLDDVERQVLEFMVLLKEHANISWSKIGISGSVLEKLHTKTSDIDPIVYGSKNGNKVQLVLKSLLEDDEDLVRPYSSYELRELFAFRSKDTITSFEDFVRTESRKVLQGKFMGRDYFIRFVKDWPELNEQYGSTIFNPMGYARIKATVIDNSESIFTPCCYKLNNVEILAGKHVEPIVEIVSFRGRFCEQARNGETVIAQGKVERMQQKGELDRYRMLLGNKTTDHMVLA